jgi:hypothetical protein
VLAKIAEMPDHDRAIPERHAFSLKELTAAEEARISGFVKRALG